MGRAKQPTALLVAKGKSHLTKAEIASRIEQEVEAPDDAVIAPEYLTKKQKEEFDQLTYELKRIGIISNVDSEALARYITSKDMYIALTKKIRTKAVIDDPAQLEYYSKIQNRYFTATRAAASDLGLTITSRAKLVVPKLPEEPKKNKFTERFG